MAFIETFVQDLRTKANIDAIYTDIREERFVVHTLQLAIQAALDSASLIVSAYRLGEPNTNRELFNLLAKDGWLTSSQNATMGNMVGLRNIVVYGYGSLNLKIVHNIVIMNLDELLDFAKSIRARVLVA